MKFSTLFPNHIIAVFLFSVTYISCQPTTESSTNTSIEELNVKQLRIDFQEAWLRGDSAAVMELMTEDVVFMPHHGDAIIYGSKDLAKYWFDPTYPPTQVVRFEADFSGAEVSSSIGYSFGRFLLSYNYEGKNYTNQGNFLTVARKESDSWKISRLIFNDPQPTVKDLDAPAPENATSLNL